MPQGYRLSLAKLEGNKVVSLHALRRGLAARPEAGARRRRDDRRRLGPSGRRAGDARRCAAGVRRSRRRHLSHRVNDSRWRAGRTRVSSSIRARRHDPIAHARGIQNYSAVSVNSKFLRADWCLLPSFEQLLHFRREPRVIADAAIAKSCPSAARNRSDSPARRDATTSGNLLARRGIHADAVIQAPHPPFTNILRKTRDGRCRALRCGAPVRGSTPKESMSRFLSASVRRKRLSIRTCLPWLMAAGTARLVSAVVVKTEAQSQSTQDAQRRERFTYKGAPEDEGPADSRLAKAGADAAAAGPAAREAPTGFDKLTNGFDPQGPRYEDLNEDNVITAALVQRQPLLFSKRSSMSPTVSARPTTRKAAASAIRTSSPAAPARSTEHRNRRRMTDGRVLRIAGRIRRSIRGPPTPRPPEIVAVAR